VIAPLSRAGNRGIRIVVFYEVDKTLRVLQMQREREIYVRLRTDHLQGGESGRISMAEPAPHDFQPEFLRGHKRVVGL
jgi:hypothetical protein